MRDKIRYYDTHAHFGHRYKNKKSGSLYDFYEDRHEILAKAYEAGIEKINNVAISITSNRVMLEDFKDYFGEDARKRGCPEIRIAIGEHPRDIGEDAAVCLDEQKDAELMELGQHPGVCAFKTGMDYHYGTDNRERQQERFRKRIQMSRDLRLPLVLHIRDATEDALRILEEESQGLYSGVVHCFTEGPETAQRYMEKGFLLGIGGKVTYEKNQALRDAVQKIPLKHLVLETDCPFIPLCGSSAVNTSLDIPVIAQAVADLKGITLDEAAEVTYKNAERLFG